MVPSQLPRALRWFALATVLLLVGGGLFILRSGSPDAVAPAAYLVTAGKDVPVRVGWHHRHVAPALALKTSQTVRIPAELQLWRLDQDGGLRQIQGPETFEVGPPANSDREFLTLPLGQLATAPLSGAVTLPPKAIPVTSPSGLTRYLNPEITWVPRDGVLYDVAVVDPADEAAPPRIVRGVRPPVRLSDLKSTQRPELPTDRIFAVVVRESGNSEVAGVARFLTARDATADEVPQEPAQLMLEAVRAATEKPMRAGDAWLALSRLPGEWSGNELVLRLRLRVASELVLTAEVQRLQSTLRKKLGQ